MSEYDVWEEQRIRMTKDCKPCPFCGSNRLDVYCCGGWWHYGCKKCHASINHAGNATVEQALAEWNTRASQWISVDDRLPDEDGEFLVTHKVVMGGDERYVSCLTFRARPTPHFEAGDAITPTHWQPKPEPYKAEDATA